MASPVAVAKGDSVIGPASEVIMLVTVTVAAVPAELAFAC